MYYFYIAAVTNYYKYYDLKWYKCIILQLWKSESKIRLTGLFSGCLDALVENLSPWSF